MLSLNRSRGFNLRLSMCQLSNANLPAAALKCFIRQILAEKHGRPDCLSSRLLAGPDDARDPVDVLHIDALDLFAWIEGGELDCFG